MNSQNMKRALIAGAAFFAVSHATAQAGPCAASIDAMQARIDARLDAIAATGRMAP
jgi:thiamine monophosphate synthase